jgi:effector-binding domain-containing protein
MKIILIAFFVILLLLAGSIYLFIPSKIIISKKINAASNQQAVLRKLTDEKEWHEWWPGKVKDQHGKIVFNYNNHDYWVASRQYSGFALHITNHSDTIISFMNFIPSTPDSVEFDWNCILENGYNPIARWQHYVKARELSRNIDTVLNHLKAFVEKRENLYGYVIQEINVKDTSLAVTKMDSRTYPSTAMIYTLIKQLKQYISMNNARETNFPMLHINTLDSMHFETMVAIPVDRELKGNDKVNYKQMVAGKILVAEVKGGPGRIKNAFLQMENFMSDFHRLSPAIPFESLITDRTLVKDTSQWKTMVYYPVYL